MCKMDEKLLNDKESLYSEVTRIVYDKEIKQIVDRIFWGSSTLVRMENEILPYIIEPIFNEFNRRNNERDVNKRRKIKLLGLEIDTSDLGYQGMLAKFHEEVKTDEADVFLFPHIDLMTAADTGLTGVTKQFIQIISSYPEITIIGFFDPNIYTHETIKEHFSSKIEIFGLNRKTIPKLFFDFERKIFEQLGLQPVKMFKYVSGLNAVRFRKLINILMENKTKIISKGIVPLIKEFTTTKSFELPDINLDNDIGGYEEVKKAIKGNIIELLTKIDNEIGNNNDERIKELENILPKGIIFHGPPGTGKTLFAKAIASSLNASMQIISGPEIKSRWHGASEEKLRKIFFEARKNAPSIVVFDELDSIAPARGLYDGGSSGVEHSIVNQLLTELDGFRSDELVIFIGTTNFLESIDPALLRPGRVELKIKIDYPDIESRKKILKIYDKKYKLDLSEEFFEYIIEKTGDFTDFDKGLRYSGDHIHSIAKFLKRELVKKGGSATMEMIRNAFNLTTKPIILSPQEEEVVALHEAGHAVLSYILLPEMALTKITILAENESFVGFTESQLKEKKYTFSYDDIKKRIMVSLGGRIAEKLLLGNPDNYKDNTTGAAGDIKYATLFARYLVEVAGASPLGAIDFAEKKILSEDWKKKVDNQVYKIITESEEQATEILKQKKNLDYILKIRQLLIEKKTIKTKEIMEVFNG